MHNRYRLLSRTCLVACASVGLTFVAAGLCFGQDSKDRFLQEYRQIAKPGEARLWKSMRVKVVGKSFDDFGKIVAQALTTYISNDTCIYAEETISPGEITNWFLLRPDGTYRIVQAQKPGEYILKGWSSGSFAPSKAGPPFVGLVFPYVRLVQPLDEYLAANNVEFLSDNTTDQFRTIRVNEKLGGLTAKVQYKFRLLDMMLDEITGTDQTGAPFRLQFYFDTVAETLRPVKLERFDGKANGTLQLRGVTEYTDYRLGNPPDTQFALARFGLPDAIGGQSKRTTPVYIWLMIGAGACVTLILLFHWLTRISKRQLAR